MACGGAYTSANLECCLLSKPSRGGAGVQLCVRVLQPWLLFPSGLAVTVRVHHSSVSPLLAECFLCGVGAVLGSRILNTAQASQWTPQPSSPLHCSSSSRSFHPFCGCHVSHPLLGPQAEVTLALKFSAPSSSEPRGAASPWVSCHPRWPRGQGLCVLPGCPLNHEGTFGVKFRAKEVLSELRRAAWSSWG